MHTPTLPWWPMDIYCFQATCLTDGRLSIIIDPGAWTNLLGEKLAREMVKRAQQHGYKPSQHPLTKPLRIQGVGNGHQECTHALRIPIAVPDGQGRAFIHTLEAPIVGGTGKDLPGLLGLKTIESLKGLVDTGGRKLILPGPELKAASIPQAPPSCLSRRPYPGISFWWSTPTSLCIHPRVASWTAA